MLGGVVSGSDVAGVVRRIVEERGKAVERRRQRVELWAHGRLVELGAELRRLGAAAAVDWGRTAWEPCLQIDTVHGREVVWCRPVAVRAEGGRVVYRMRFVWSDDPRLVRSHTYPASDVPRAARRVAEFARGRS